MNCQKCGHPQEAHIYLEGACRPGFVCPCDHYVPPKDPGKDPDQVIILKGKLPIDAYEIKPGQITMTARGVEKVLQVEDLKRDLKLAADLIEDHTGDETLRAWAEKIRKKWGLS